ncbi:hypothetical protein ACFVW1_38950 [Streptomyces olivochromogenes]|uniref:hypothetical protein n=1 Tax=Streptomyces olivochromogenes TaxID=1963 RepID=UPI0036D7B361
MVGAGDKARFVIKIARTHEGYARETFAYRHAVPALGAGNAPRLPSTFPSLLALLLTDPPGLPLPDLHVKAAALQRIHWRCGALVAQLHRAGKPTAADQQEASTAMSRLADDVRLHLDAAGDRLSTDEQTLVLHLADRLHVLGRLPLGFVHGCLERSLVWGPKAHLSLRDFEAAGFAPVVVDFARLTCSPRVAHPRLRNDFLSGYGRALSWDERRALRALTALYAVRALAADTTEHGHRQAAEDAQMALARLTKEVRARHRRLLRPAKRGSPSAVRDCFGEGAGEHPLSATDDGSGRSRPGAAPAPAELRYTGKHSKNPSHIDPGEQHTLDGLARHGRKHPAETIPRSPLIWRFTELRSEPWKRPGLLFALLDQALKAVGKFGERRAVDKPAPPARSVSRPAHCGPAMTRAAAAQPTSPRYGTVHGDVSPGRDPTRRIT